MFGLGIPEMLVIAVIALIIFGPKRLPEMGQSLGQALREFKKGAESVASEVKSTVDIDGLNKDINETVANLADAGKAVTEPLTSQMEDSASAQEPKKV